MAYFARPANEDGAPQLLREHLQNVGKLAGDFAEAIGFDRRLGEWAGWLHDLGKYADEFQRHRLCLEPDGKPVASPERKQVEHAAYGAAVALGFQREVGAAIAAHHAGLPPANELEFLPDRLERTYRDPRPVGERAAIFVERGLADDAFPEIPARELTATTSELSEELRTRMLLSCLVDADRLDAERWANGDSNSLRKVPSLEPSKRLEDVLGYIGTQRRRAAAAGTAEEVLNVRAEVLEHCLAAGEKKPGFFSLTVPTGGGKTLASLAFALRHAHRHEKRRVIVVAPFLAIIEQNAAVIRTALGSDAEGMVLEHHSQADGSPGDDGQQSLAEVRRRLIAENWDAPVVITTTVQFFESLFSNRPGQVRKVHNIAGSVIVFDEAQTFPPGILRPLVGMLEQLVEEYGCTVVFATATQPALSHPRLRERLLQEVSREIISNPAELFEKLKRVEVDWSRATQPTALSAIAAEMAGARQALAIVNTKQQARELFASLVERDEEAIHLSGRMCPAHRLQVLEVMRERLAAGEECRVASTSSLEAGVDVSFPRLWRALAPFDSIAQAAGRCNRDGRLDRGQVIVFEPQDGKAPPGVYQQGRELTRQLLARGPSIDDPDDFARYFTSLYNNTNLDADGIVAKRMSLEFPDVAKLRVIEEQTTPVLVPFGGGRQMIDDLLAGRTVFVDRQLRRRMERYMVALYSTEFEAARDAGWVVEVAGVWLAPANYDPQVGLAFDNEVLVD